MSTDETPATSPGKRSVAKVTKVVNITACGTGDLIEAFLVATNNRIRLVNQFLLIKQAAQQKPDMVNDARFQTQFKEARVNYAQAHLDCDKIKTELNIRFQLSDAKRLVQLDEQSQA